MAENNNNELQNTLDAINQTMSTLNASIAKNSAYVKELNKSIGSMVATTKESAKITKAEKIDDSKLDSYINKLKKVLTDNLAGAARRPSGELTPNAKGRITRVANELREELLPVFMQTQARNKDNKKSPIEISDTLEGANKIYDKIMEHFRDKLEQDKGVYKAIFSELGVSTSSRRQLKGKEALSQNYKVRYNEEGQISYIENASSDFAKLRTDIVALQKVTSEAYTNINQMNTSVSNVSKNLQDLADQSEILKNMLNQTSTSAEGASNTLHAFVNALGATADPIKDFVKTQERSTRRINNATSRFVAQQGQLTRATQTFTSQIINNATRTGGTNQTGSTDNTFKRQTEKNNSRARQAGFIALLIPALAKLLSKSPLTDIIKVAGLMVGKYLPEIGAVFATLAPLITAAAITKGSGLLMKMYGARGAAATVAGTAARGRGGQIAGATLGSVLGSKMTLGAKARYFSRWWEGVRQSVTGVPFTPDYLRHGTTFGKLNTAHKKITIGPDNYKKIALHEIKRTYRNNPDFQGAPELAARANLAGRNAMGRARRLWIGNNKFFGKGARYGPMVARFARTNALWAVGGEVLGDIFSGKFTDAYRQGGWGGVGAQTLKTGGKAALVGGGTWAGGLAGGKIGAMIGTIGGPLGIAIGGAAGAIIGSIVGGTITHKLGKHLTDFGKSVWKTNKETVSSTLRLAKIQSEEHPILTNILTGLNTLLGMLSPLTAVLALVNHGLRKWGFGNTSDPNKLRDEGVEQPKLWSRIKNQFNLHKSYKEADKQSKKTAIDYSRMQKWLSAVEKIGSKDYNAEIRGFEQEYDQWYKGDPSIKSGLWGYTEEYKQARRAYAMAKLSEKMGDVRAKINGLKTLITGAREIDESQLIDPGTMLTWTQSQAEQILSKRTGAYERLQDKKGYWSIGDSFWHDVPFVGRGVQSQLAGLVDAGLPAGFTITSAIGAKGDKDGKYGHTASYNKGHFSSMGNVIDITYDNQQDWDNAVAYLSALQKAGVPLTFIDERPGKPGEQYIGTGSNLHIELSNSIKNSQMEAAQALVQSEQATAAKTSAASLEASSELREGLTKAIGEKNREDKSARARSIIFAATDVTGSLGVWGITQINNTGKDAGRGRTGI